MKSYKLEIENGIEYVVINLTLEEVENWKKFVKENFDFLKNPHFKFIIFDSNGKYYETFYTKKYKLHNFKGPAFLDPWGQSLYLDGVKYDTEEEYINELRKRILNTILNG